jgi:hypothetical protein
MNREEVKFVLSALWGRIWSLHIGPDENTVIPSDRGGYIMPRAEWEEMQRKVNAFYESSSDEAIDSHNDALDHKNHLGKYYDPPCEREPMRPKIARPGYIYLFHAENSEWYKIGVSSSPENRVRAVKAKAQSSVVIVTYFAVDNMGEAEVWWHKCFSSKRGDGEWFALNEEEIEFFVFRRGIPLL